MGNTIKNVSILSFKLLIIILLLLLIIKFCPDQIIIFLTFLAIIVALFRENLLNFYLPPKLRITTSTNTEHFQEVEERDVETRKLIENQYWLSVRVENVGLGIARNVSVFFNGIDSNKIKNFYGYKSLQLKRSYLPNPVVSSIPPRIGFNFSFFYLSEKNKQKVCFHFVITPNALVNIICEENEISLFKFEIIAVSDNANISKQKVLIEFKGDYNNNFNIKLL